MENTANKKGPILGFDELFEDGIIVDGSNVSLDEVDELMKQYSKRFFRDQKG